MKVNKEMPSDDTFLFTEEQTLKFLRLYKKEQLLWNPNLPEYTQRAKRKEALQRIVNSMGLERLQQRHIKLKIRSYRDMYTREMKKYPNNEDLPGMTKPFWLKEMRFLDNLKKGTEVFIDDEEDNTTADYTEKNSYNFFTEAEDPIEMKEEPMAEEGIEEYIVLQEEATCPDVEQGAPKSKRAKHVRNQEEIESASRTEEKLLVTIDKNQTETLNILKNQQREALKEDDLDNFAKYIASLLRNLPRSRAYSLQPKIVAMITAEHVRIASRNESIHGDAD